MGSLVIVAGAAICWLSVRYLFVKNNNVKTISNTQSSQDANSISASSTALIVRKDELFSSIDADICVNKYLETIANSDLINDNDDS